MKLLLQLLALILNRLPKTDWQPIPLCNVYGRYGLDAPNLVGHVSAPSVTTDTTPSSITSSSAVFDTNSITNTGGANATERGICWVTGAGGTPTTSNSTSSETGSFGTGNFSRSMSGLSPGTTYSVRAYAINSAGTGYGAVVEVTTTSVVAPTVTTSAETSITTSGFTGNGNITATGGANATARGIVVVAGTGTPTLSNTVFTDTGSFGTGAFSKAATGLSPGTLYTYRAYATNSAGTGYGGNEQVTTTAVAPTVTTQAVSSIDVTTATGNGNVTSDGGATITQRGVCWNTTGTPTTSDSTATSAGTTGAFTASMTGLTGSTLYYVRAYAINSQGTSYGGQVTFTTSAPPNDPPTVALNSPAGPNVAFVSSTLEHSPGYNNSHTISFSTSGTDRLGVVVIGCRHMDDVVGVTWDGVAMTEQVDAIGGSTTRASRIYTIVNPPTSASNVVLDLGSNYRRFSMFVACYTGVDQTAPVEAITVPNTGGFGATSNRNITTISSGALVLDAIQTQDSVSLTAGSGQTARGNSTHPATDQGTLGVSEKASSGAGLVPMSWTLGTSGNYAHCAVAVKPTAPVLTSSTPTLEFTGTDPDDDDIRYNTQVHTHSGFGLATYYFDGSVAINDPDSNFTNGANSFDGDIDTGSTISLPGSSSSDYLEGKGTNAPSNGGAITQVRARLRINGTYGSYVTLSAPAGGWTWGKLSKLETRMWALFNFISYDHSAAIYVEGDAGGTALATALRGPIGTQNGVQILELEVTSDLLLDKTSNTDSGFANITTPADTDPFNSGDRVGYTVQAGDALAADTYYWRIRGLDPSGSNTYGAWSSTRSFEVTSSGATLVTQDTSQSFTLDNTTITQNHILANQDIAHSFTLDNTTITQNHVLAPADISHSFTLDNTTIEQTYTITTQDIQHGLTLDTTTITQNHVITPDDIAFSHALDATAISQNHILVTEDIQQGLTVDTTTINQTHVLAPQDVEHGLTLDNTTIAQNHVVATQDTSQGLTLDNTTISQNHILATQDIQHGLTLDTTTVSEDSVNYDVVVQDTELGLTIDNATITQNHILTPDDIAFNVTTDNGTVTETNFNLTAQDISHGLSVDTTTISQNHVIAAQDISHSFTIDTTTIDQSQILATQDIELGLNADNTTLAQNHILTPDDIAFSHALDDTTISQNHVLATQDISQELTLDNTTLAQNHVLTSNDISHGFTVDTTTISQTHVIATQDISHTSSIDATTITQNHVIATDDIGFSFTADEGSISQNHVIATNDISHSFTVDNTTLDQSQILLTQDISHALTTDNTTITQAQVITPDDISHGLTLDTTTLTQLHVVAVDDIVMGFTEDNGTINQIHVLSPADIEHAVQLDNTTVEAATTNYDLATSDVTFGTQPRKYYIDSDGNVFWLINERIGLVIKI